MIELDLTFGTYMVILGKFYFFSGPLIRFKFLFIMRSNMTKNFCFTANGGKTEFPSETIENAFSAEDSVVQYFIIGLEGLDAGKTEHWQGFLQTKRQVRWSTLNKLLPDAGLVAKKRKKSKWQTWHWANKVAKSTCEQARDYCKKEEGEIHEWGEFVPGSQGKRTDIHEFADAIKAGSKKMALIDAYPEQMLKFRGNALKMVADLEARDIPNIRPVTVYVLWGPTGSGKTYTAMTSEETDQVYLMHCSQLEKGWWDGYEEQNTLVLDEWTPSSCNITVMLWVLDSYKKRLKVHHGQTYAHWNRVIVTTNKNWLAIGEAYNDVYPGADIKHQQALHRRITKVYHMDKPWKEMEKPLLPPPEVEEEKEEKEGDVEMGPPALERHGAVVFSSHSED